MGKKLYVGNLAYSIRNDDLSQVFAEVGEVVSAKVIMDQATGRSKGFGFVEMATDEQGDAAISSLNGKEVGGRPIKVTEANPRPERPRVFEGGGDRGGRGGFGGDRGGRGGGGGFNRDRRPRHNDDE